ncbi:hypothetical protein TVAG_323700 [Trichomonas vaginalis G3]|uniref:Initiator binding domain-containing protein n=1 Tax=Trichomonas vaginalis (strain ATCC PRA-98 / G3) TaxID=412133 RepID=A2FTW4_TRIV3|nr:transcription-initiator DNA-binding domain ibd family [Trichomonas vaginalis G3]EAX91654.1 hypothetical protein TVAG_323700 [Trichomonas vaginalis G3]KAI5539662.1 transcription-initiator DNA-binding domain ibd family [Trichomonas vaginalis G3]|eukprot:XP_001304584.1 hypothetical protein [Trichomonas vaginalis G3]
MSKDDFWLNSPTDPPSSDWALNSPQRSGFVDPIDMDLPYMDSPLQMNFDPTLPPSPNPTSPGQIPDLIFGDTPAEFPNFAPPQLIPQHRRTPSSPARAPMFNFAQYREVPAPAAEAPEAKRTQPIVQPTPQHTRSLTSPATLPAINDGFEAALSDPGIKFNPKKLGFIPSKIWTDQEFSFGYLVQNFFQKKNNANSRFSHKLYNALKIAESDRLYADLLGVEWLNDRVLRVEKNRFARLLGIRTIDGSFFHQQGNFPSHGFIELDPNTAPQMVTPKDLEGVDYDNVRLLFHSQNIFIRGCNESVLEACKWTSSRKRNV